MEKTIKWADVRGYEGLYKISTDGQVLSLHQNKPLGRIKPSRLVFNNYLAIRLTKNKVHFGAFIHRLIAQAFIPNPTNLPQINHKDGNKLNNSIENLEWCTAQENIQHAFIMKPSRITRGINVHTAKLNEEEVLSIRSKGKYATYRAMEKDYKVGRTVLENILKRKSWTHI